MFMVWSETAKLGPSSTSGGGSPHRVWLRGPAAFPQDKLAFGLLRKTRPQRQQNHLVKSGFFVPVAQGSLCVLETASSAKNNHRVISPVCKGPRHHFRRFARCRLGHSCGCCRKPTTRHGRAVNRDAPHAPAAARPPGPQGSALHQSRPARATARGPPRRSAHHPLRAQASRRPAGPLPRHR